MVPDEIKLAHLSDIHLGPIRGFTPRHWNPKRLTGYLNWMRHRRHDHSRDVADRLIADALAHRPDHIAITGDLANIGLPQEHVDALAWLATVGDANAVSVVPGNHDIYTRIGRDVGTARWSPYMADDLLGRAAASEVPNTFPFVRRLQWIGIVGVNSAVRTPPFAAWGEVGERQRRRLATVLDALGREGLARIVLIHHPPLAGQAGRMRGLKDAAEVERVLIRHGAELVLHGHNHRNMMSQRATAVGGTMVVIGAPSASLRHGYKNEPPARYNLLRLSQDAESTSAPGLPSVRIGLTGRGLAEPDGPVIALEERTLLAGSTANRSGR